MNFYYNFDIKKEFPHLANLPVNELSNIESNIVQVIYESFLIPGDQDYLTARLLAQKGLHRAFFWAASQTIEKYLKAFLLLNGHSVINHKGHPIKKLLQGAIKVNKNLGDIHLNLHEDLNIDSTVGWVRLAYSHKLCKTGVWASRNPTLGGNLTAERWVTTRPTISGCVVNVAMRV